MTELERALVALGHELDIPSVPSLATGVRARIKRRARVRRTLVLAFAVLVVAVAVAMAVPPARTAILRFFHIGSVTIERVETLPPARTGPRTLGLGPARSRGEAERVAGFRIVLPHFKGAPPKHYYALPGLIATVVRSGPASVLLTEMNGDQFGLSKKLVVGATRVQPVEVGPYFGMYISGGRHVIAYEGPNGYVEVHARLAGNTILWVATGHTYRLEGPLSRAAAIRLARLVTP